MKDLHVAHFLSSCIHTHTHTLQCVMLRVSLLCCTVFRIFFYFYLFFFRNSLTFISCSGQTDPFYTFTQSESFTIKPPALGSVYHSNNIQGRHDDDITAHETLHAETSMSPSIMTEIWMNRA